MEISIIAAIAENGVIGDAGSIPWNYPEDMKHFREVTTGNPVIMGRITHEDILSKLGQPLPERRSIVLTSSPERVQTIRTDDKSGIESLQQVTEVYTAQSIDEALAIAQTDYSDTVYIAGGASVYDQFLPVADEMILTELHQSHPGDAEFPTVTWDDWKEAHRSKREYFDFVTYTRQKRTSITPDSQ